MLRRFFPEMGKHGSKGDQEAAASINLAACTLVLVDFIKEFRKHYNRFGPGVLFVNLVSDATGYLDIDDIKADIAESQMPPEDTYVNDFLSSVLDKIGNLDPENETPVMLVDNSTMSLMVLNNENPGGGIEQMMKIANGRI